jgi:hypothetical protein
VPSTRQRAKSVVLHFEQPLGMVEGLGKAHKRHRSIEHRRQPRFGSAGAGSAFTDRLFSRLHSVPFLTTD